MISKQKNTERCERKQQKIDAGVVSARFPNIETIVITMDYYQKGATRLLMQRTINFFPGSFAYFNMECMKTDCTDGGFNLEPVINTMVKGRANSKDGKLVCGGNNSSGHTRVDYNIAIQYKDSGEKKKSKPAAK